MQREERVAVAARQAPVLARGEHQPARRIVLLQGAARVRADLHAEHVADAKLGADAEEQGRDAERIGVGQLGEVARAHQDFHFRPEPPELSIAKERGGEAEMDGIEDRIGEIAEPPRLGGIDRPQQRIEVAGNCRDEDRHGAALVGYRKRRFRQAEQKVRAGPVAAPELVRIGGVHADPKTLELQRANRFFEMRERRIGQAAEIDHVGAGRSETPGLLNDRRYADLGRLDDLGKDADVGARQIGRRAAAAEEGRQIGDLVGAAHERHAEFGGKPVEVGAAAAGHHDPIRRHRARHAAADDGLGHQRRHLHADVEDLAVEVAGAEAF